MVIASRMLMAKKTESREYIESLLVDIAILALNEGAGAVRSEDEPEYWQKRRRTEETVRLALEGRSYLPRDLSADDSLADLFSKVGCMVQQLDNLAG